MATIALPATQYSLLAIVRDIFSNGFILPEIKKNRAALIQNIFDQDNPQNHHQFTLNIF